MFATGAVVSAAVVIAALVVALWWSVRGSATPVWSCCRGTCISWVSVPVVRIALRMSVLSLTAPGQCERSLELGVDHRCALSWAYGQSNSPLAIAARNSRGADRATANARRSWSVASWVALGLLTVGSTGSTRSDPRHTTRTSRVADCDSREGWPNPRTVSCRNDSLATAHVYSSRATPSTRTWALTRPGSVVFSWLLSMLAEDVGFPVPEGGADDHDSVGPSGAGRPGDFTRAAGSVACRSVARAGHQRLVADRARCARSSGPAAARGRRAHPR